MNQQAIAYFLKAEEDIYDINFRQRQKELQKNGLLPDPVIVEKMIGGIAVVVRHGQQIVDKLEEFIELIPTHVELFGYNRDTEHSTICVKDSPNFVFDESLHREQVDHFTAAINQVLHGISPAQIREAVIQYGRPIHNATTVIIPAEASSSAYVDLKLQIAAACNVDPGWGNHITAARFLEAVPASRLKGFFSLMKGAPIFGPSSIAAIDVATCECRNNKLFFTTRYSKTIA